MCSHAASAADFREKALKAEALGYSTLFVPDHFIDHPLAPMPAMATAAAATDTLRVGSLVLANDYKHPVVLAREAATLDLLSDGRLELGLGAGWMTADWTDAGLSSASLSVGHITQARLPAITIAAKPAPRPAIDRACVVMAIPLPPAAAGASKKP